LSLISMVVTSGQLNVLKSPVAQEIW
jgi:hypothetical protein